MTWRGPANSIASMAAVKPTRARDREIIVSPVSGATMRFDVVVKDDRSESRHEVTLSEVSRFLFIHSIESSQYAGIFEQ